MTYKERKQKARIKAQELQQRNCTRVQSWADVLADSEKMQKIGKHYGLIKEFKNEGIL